MKRPFISFLLLLLTATTAFSQKERLSGNIKIGVLSPDLAKDESLGVQGFLEDQNDFQTVNLSYKQLNNGSVRKLGLTHIWMHKLSAAGNSKQEIAAGNTLKDFVKKGGNLGSW